MCWVTVPPSGMFRYNAQSQIFNQIFSPRGSLHPKVSAGEFRSLFKLESLVDYILRVYSNVLVFVLSTSHGNGPYHLALSLSMAWIVYLITKSTINVHEEDYRGETSMPSAVTIVGINLCKDLLTNLLFFRATDYIMSILLFVRNVGC